MAFFEGSVRAAADSILARYPEAHRRSALMPLLYLAQSVDGWITRDALREIGEILGITTAEVEAVASFYTMLRLRPTGEHVVSVCTNLSCSLRGAKDVLEAAREAAGVPDGGELSEDGLITLHEEECLGVCEFAPVVQINAMNHDDVSAERVVELIGGLRGGEVPAPSRGRPVGSFKEASRILAGLEHLEAGA
jgi:NADH-quinone oxidoreductase subunit E